MITMKIVEKKPNPTFCEKPTQDEHRQKD